MLFYTEKQQIKKRLTSTESCKDLKQNRKKSQEKTCRSEKEIKRKQSKVQNLKTKNKLLEGLSFKSCLLPSACFTISTL